MLEPLNGTDHGTAYARGRSASRKRSTITDRCAIVNDSSAPNAKIPISSSRLAGSTSAAAASGRQAS